MAHFTHQQKFEIGLAWVMRARSGQLCLAAQGLKPGDQVALRLPPISIWQKVTSVTFTADCSSPTAVHVTTSNKIAEKITLPSGTSSVVITAESISDALRDPSGGLSTIFEPLATPNGQTTSSIETSTEAIVSSTYDIKTFALLLASLVVVLISVLTTIIAGYIPLLQLLFGQLFTSLGVALSLVFGLSLSATKILNWLQSNLVANAPVVSTFAFGISLAALASMLLDYVDIQHTKYSYTSQWNRLLDDFTQRNGYLDPSELRTAILEWPNRPELWSLMTISSYRYLFSTRHDGQSEATRYFRQLLKTEGAFKGESPEVFERPDLVADRILELCQATKESAERASFAVIPFPLATSPLKAQCQFSLVYGIQSILPLAGKSGGDVFANTRLLIARLEERGDTAVTLAVPIKLYVDILTEARDLDKACARETPATGDSLNLHCARKVAAFVDSKLDTVSQDNPFTEDHLFQELLAVQIDAYAGYCAALVEMERGNEPSLNEHGDELSRASRKNELSAIRQKLEHHIQGLLTFRSNRNRGRILWASMPRRLPLHMALFLERWGNSFKDAAEMAKPYFDCFESQSNFQNFVKNFGNGEAAEFGWWFKGTLMPKSLISKEGDLEAVQVELNEMATRGWRL